MDDIVERWLAGEEPSPYEEVHGAWERFEGCERCDAEHHEDWNDYLLQEEGSVLIFSPDDMDVLILWLRMRFLAGKDQKHLETLCRLWEDSRYTFEGVGDDRYDRDDRSVFIWRCSNKRL